MVSARGDTEELDLQLPYKVQRNRLQNEVAQGALSVA